MSSLACGLSVEGFGFSAIALEFSNTRCLEQIMISVIIIATLLLSLVELVLVMAL